MLNSNQLVDGYNLFPSAAIHQRILLYYVIDVTWAHLPDMYV